MAEYIVMRNSDGKDDGRPGWMHREVRDHDRRYECDGHIFVDGPWGGLVCEKWPITLAATSADTCIAYVC